MVLLGVRGFREDYEEHILHGRCICGLSHPVPCVSTCPPMWTFQAMWPWSGRGGTRTRCASSVKDNPFPAVCAYVCEHPCEASAGGGWWMTAVNICGLKRYAVDHAPDLSAPPGRRTLGRGWPSSAAAPAV